MRKRTLLFGPIGVLATVLAGLLVFYTGAVGDVTSVVRDIETSTLLFLCAFLLGLTGLWATWMRGSPTASETAFDTAVELSPESVTATDDTFVAASTDATIDAAVGGDTDAMSALVAQLRTAAATAYSMTADTAPDVAQQAVRSGRWTDDTIATAFLASETDQPLLARFRLWLDPPSERERRIRRTIDEIDRLYGDDR